MTCDWTDSEREALRSYKNYAAELNALLRAGATLIKENEQQVALLDSATRRCPSAEPLRLYRAAPWGYGDVQIGFEYIDLAFTSASRTGPLIVQHFESRDDWPNPARRQISCPSGSLLAEIEEITGAKGDEDEVLIARGARFRVTSFQCITDPAAIRAIVSGLVHRPWLNYPYLFDVQLEYLP
jgi:hypothetical protein